MKNLKDLKKVVSNKKLVVPIIGALVLSGLVLGLLNSQKAFTSNPTKSYFMVEDTKVEFPLKTSELEEMGYKLDLDKMGISKDDKLVANDIYGNNIPLLKDKESTGVFVKIKNDTDEAVKVKDSYIQSVRITTTNSDISLQDGVKVGITEKELEELFGKPVSEEEDNGIKYVKYFDGAMGYITVEFIDDVSISVELSLQTDNDSLVKSDEE